MKIKKANKKDLKKIAEIMRTEFAKHPFRHKSSLSSVLKSLNFYMKVGKIYVVWMEQKILGVVVFKEEQFWEGSVILIEDLAVDEKFEKQNIEEGLLEFVESYAKKRKAKFIGFVTNRKSNAINFYQKQGYKIKKDRIVMEKLI